MSVLFWKPGRDAQGLNELQPVTEVGAARLAVRESARWVGSPPPIFFGLKRRCFDTLYKLEVLLVRGPIKFFAGGPKTLVTPLVATARDSP